jgi:TonB family protein
MQIRIVQISSQQRPACIKTRHKKRESAQTAALAAANVANMTNNSRANVHGNGNSNSNDSGNQVKNTSSTSAGNFVLPKSLLSSDLANRAREQTKGLDLLRGTPPLVRTDVAEKPRRRSVFGSIEKDVPLRMYVDSWKQKIERNGSLNYSQLSKDRARGDPVVNVSLRSDGSVEEVTIIRSSGRADLDEAVRRIVRLNAKYAAFPPNIAAQYDVIDIRRIWNFDETLKIIDELH